MSELEPCIQIFDKMNEMSKTNLIWCVYYWSVQWLLTHRYLLEYSIYQKMEDHLIENNFHLMRLQVLESVMKSPRIIFKIFFLSLRSALLYENWVIPGSY